MFSKLVKGIILLAILQIVGYALYVTFREQPVLVDLASVSNGPMVVTIDEEGITRVRDVYALSAPIAGHLDRVDFQEGDAVAKGQAIASIHPLDPPFIDQRSRAELLAIIEASRASVSLAEVEKLQAETELDLARSNYERARILSEKGTISESQLDQNFSLLQMKIAQLESATAGIELRKAELASAQAKLVQPSDYSPDPEKNNQCCVAVLSPVNGVILSVAARSEQVVSLGTLIAEVGALEELEVEVDLLSSDAVQIAPGAKAIISDWGGTDDLVATVRRVDPAAFTKTSALGIDEQRVNVLLDLEEVPQGLGHGYRVFARLTIWETENAMQVPIGALFRSDGEWAVFVASQNEAKLRKISLGRMNTETAHVLDGLGEGDEVVLFPSDQIEDGRMIEDRARSE